MAIEGKIQVVPLETRDYRPRLFKHRPETAHKPVTQRTSRYKDAPLGPASAKVYAFILAEIEAGRPFPRKYKIKEHMGYNQQAGIHECFGTLARHGLIESPGTDSMGRRIWRLTAESANTDSHALETAK